MALDEATSTTTSTAKPDQDMLNAPTAIGEGKEEEAEPEETDGLPANLTDISAEDTLKGSRLTTINVNETTDDEIRNEFCREVGVIAGKFQRQNEYFGPAYNADNPGIAQAGQTIATALAVVLAILLAVCCCGCICLCLCLSKVKDCLGGDGGNKYEPDHAAADVDMNDMGPGGNAPDPAESALPQFGAPAAPGYAPVPPPPAAGGDPMTQPLYPAPAGDVANLPYPQAGANLPYPVAPPASGPPPYPAQPSYPTQPGESNTSTISTMSLQC